VRRVFKPSVLEVRHAARWAINQAYADIVGPEAEPVSELIAMDAWTHGRMDAWTHGRMDRGFEKDG
jgi:hypothetical protein